MEHPITARLRNGLRRTETGLGEIEEARAKKRRELSERRRPCEILCGRKRNERKPRNGAPVN